jgi:hypothetical protein
MRPLLVVLGYDRYKEYAGFFLPVTVLSRIFRGKFVEALRCAYDRNALDLSGGSEHLRAPAAWRAFVDALFETNWVVYAKPAFGGAAAVLRYLGRHTHRVAISNHRLLAFDGEHDYSRAGTIIQSCHERKPGTIPDNSCSGELAP